MPVDPDACISRASDPPCAISHQHFGIGVEDKLWWQSGKIVRQNRTDLSRNRRHVVWSKLVTLKSSKLGVDVQIVQFQQWVASDIVQRARKACSGRMSHHTAR